jgi:uncharacterized protein (TIGR03546 family)
MITFKLIRKIGKMLRGGAGKKEIFLGAFLGVLLGFNPTLSLTLFLALLITLLLNANIGFTMLGVALGKVAGLALSVVTFHVGFFIIHNLGMEGLFTKLVNSPVLALMDLNVYSMIGSLPFALIIGIAFGKFMSATVTKIREQMVKAGQNEKVGKVAGNKFSKFLMWLAFGKQKISTEDVLAKQSPLMRKSGIILVAVVLVIGLLMEFLLADIAIRKGIEASIAKNTGAEVNIEKVHFSMGGGKLEVINLEITDPEKPTHNMVQVDQLAADLSMADLLRKTYTIDLLSGSVLKRDTERASPGKVYEKAEKGKEDKAGEDSEGGKSIEEYLAKGEEWKKYGEKVQEYLKERKEKAEAAAKEEKVKASKEKAVADAKKVGYLKAAADLVADRPVWTIRKVEIDNVHLDAGYPVQKLEASEVSSHPELNLQPTSFVMTPQGDTEPTAKVVLRFDDYTAMHEVAANMKGVDVSDSFNTENLTVKKAVADITADGRFSVDSLDLPFTLLVSDLETDNETVNALKKLELPGKLYGSLASPRIKVELNDQLKDAVVDAAKEKAKEEAQKEAEKQMNKALESDEAQDLKNKASEGLKKLF